MLASLLLSRKEKDALSAVTAAVGSFLPQSSAAPLSIGDILDQLRGTVPAEGAVADIIRLLRRMRGVPSFMDALVTVVLSESEKRGIAPGTIASLASKAATLLRIDLGEAVSPTEIVRTTLASLADRETTSDSRIGAVCVCPSCSFTFFV